MVFCIIGCCIVCVPCCCIIGGYQKSIVLQNYLNLRRNSISKMGMLLGCCKQLLWMLARLLFLLFRTIIWLLTMRYFKIFANYRTGAYKQTVHVQRILLRHKFDHMIQPARASNFLTIHKCFKDPDYLLRRNISLYSLTKSEAVFVECDSNIDVTNSNISSFIRIAQFKHAKNLIVIPMHVFLKLSAVTGSYTGNLIFIANTGRCGSTLLTQVFEETKQCVAFSEPDALNLLSTLSNQLPSKEFDALVKATINVLCKNPQPQIKSVVIKLSQTNLELIPFISKLFPDSHNIFMYRDGISVAKSVAKTVNGTPLANILVKMSRNYTCINIGRYICKKAGLPVSMFDNFDCLYNPFFVGTIMWASSIRQYLDFRKDGIDIVAVRYEDMTSDTNYALEQIFKYCTMEYDKNAVDKAFSRDSQRGSPISQKNLVNVDHEEITELICQQTDYACEVFRVPSIYKTYIADHTISYRSFDDSSPDTQEGFNETTNLDLETVFNNLKVHTKVELVNELQNTVQLEVMNV